MLKNKNLIYIAIAAAIAVLITLPVLGPILDNDCIVQDDFRQSFFWVWKFWDPSLFPNDFFVEMYQGHVLRTPLIYLLFRLAPLFTDNLIWFSKFLDFVIAIASGIVAYLFMYEYKRKPALALAFTIAMSTLFWSTDHLSSSSPRSFIWLGLLLYMYWRLQEKTINCGILCFILLLLSPHTFLPCLGVEFFHGIFKYKQKFFNIKNLQFLSLTFNALSTIILYKVIFKDVKTQGVGTPFTVAEMKSLPEFNPGGRHPIFGSHIWDGTWWTNEHWGLGIGYLKISEIIIFALALALVYIFYSLVKKHKIQELLFSIPMCLLYSSLSLYFLAQMIFPVLYLPSRYIAASSLLLSVIVVFVFADWFLDGFFKDGSSSKKAKTKKDSSSVNPGVYKYLPAICVLFCGVYFWYHYHNFYHTRFVSISPDANYAIGRLPKNAVIAGHPLLPDLNTASITAKRIVYIDYERSMAYTHESLAEIRLRNEIAIRMTYAKTEEEFGNLALKAGITHFLASYALYSPQYLASPVYMEPYNALQKQLVTENNGQKFFLQKLLEEKKQPYTLIKIDIPLRELMPDLKIDVVDAS